MCTFYKFSYDSFKSIEYKLVKYATGELYVLRCQGPREFAGEPVPLADGVTLFIFFYFLYDVKSPKVQKYG